MKFLLFLIISGTVFAAGPDCRRECDPVGTPEVPNVLRDIRENVTGTCVDEIVVRPPHADDPCSLTNLDSSLYHDEAGGQIEWSTRVDRTYDTTGRCSGEVVNNLCYIRRNSIYAQGGSARWQRDPESGGYILSLKQSQDCRDRRDSQRGCTIPYERAALAIAVEYEDMYDVQDKEDSVVECKPSNCYSITIQTNNYRTPGGYSVPIFQMVTVTREPNGNIRSRLYVNGPFITTDITKDGVVGEDRVQANLIGKPADTFPSCSEDFAERRRSYFPR